MTNFLRRTAKTVVLTTALSMIASAAVSINFDSLAAGTVLTNQFAAQGVTFDGGFTADNNTYGGNVIVPSSPNYIYINNGGTTTITFQSGGVPAVTDNFQFQLPGLVNGPGCYAGATVVVKDIHGNVLAAGGISAVNPNSGGVAVTPFPNPSSYPGTHSVVFTYVANGSCPGGLLNLDNLVFDTPVVPAPPTITKSFSPSTIAVGGTSTLSFTISNPSTSATTNTTLTGVAASDTLPSGVVVATPNGLAGSCGGGTITATAGSGSITLGGASLAPGASCTFSVNVTGTTVGLKNNSVSVTSNEGGAGVNGTATLTVAIPPTISKAFTDSQVQLLGPGNTTSLTFTVGNPAGNISLSTIAFSDTLPSGLIVATPNNITGACGGGTITAVAGGSSISLSGATLAAGTTCTFSVDVSGVAIGVQVNTTGAVTALNGAIVGSTTTATTVVNDLFFYWFFAADGGGSSH